MVLKCGCPYCSKPAKRLLKGFNDLAYKYPDIAAEWHPTKNQDLTPDQVLCGSARKVWWLGKCGHEYEQCIVNRVTGCNCPYCSHQQLLVGFNDLATTNPDILVEWDYNKNDVSPTEIGAGAHYKAWWICPFGHSYQANVYSRCGKTHTGCSICNKEHHTSFPEQAVFYYVKMQCPEAINTDRNAIGMELDVYIPSKRIAIEYDGKIWHKNNKSELKKNQLCKENNILLIRIREEGLDLFDDCYCLTRANNNTNNSLSEVIKKVLNILDSKSTIDVDVERDASLIYSSYINTKKSKSLKNTYPELASTWHPTKNGNLTAEMIAPMANKRVWWLGKCGHEWQSDVATRVAQRTDCPYCSGKRVLKGFNDLLTLYPTLCLEWDYEKNRDITPDNVLSHSDRKVWWKCQTCGHKWNAKIDSRTRMKAGCPVCGLKTISQSKFKPVKCIETGIVYESLMDAEDKTGINRHCISNCCRKTQKTAGKLHWEFV